MKNYFSKACLLLPLLVTIALACEKESVIEDTIVDETLVDIYLAGALNGVATSWKNGQPVTLPSGLPTESGATSIVVAGNDIYVAGWEGDGFSYGQNIAKYWKNGEEVLLTGPTGAGANSITVVGDDVYVAGWELKGNQTVAKYWKNSQPVSLTDGNYDAEATGIVVTDSNVYVSGHEKGVAKYWKNGQPVLLSNGTHQAFANSIAVVGNDVYVAGSEKGVAKYWKNGQDILLTDGIAPYASATSMTVNENDVYVTGWEGDFFGATGGSGATAIYWKNGQRVELTAGSSWAYPTSIAIYNDDVYVCGNEYNTSLPVASRYWTNGSEMPVTVSINAYVSSIHVVPR